MGERERRIEESMGERVRVLGYRDMNIYSGGAISKRGKASLYFRVNINPVPLNFLSLLELFVL